MNKKITTLLCAALALTPIQTLLAAEIGTKVPDCALMAINGTQNLDLQQFRGKVVYVDFWSSWCPPCAKSIPFLNDLDRDLKESGLQVIGINMDQAPEDAMAFLAKYPADFTVASDANEKCAKNFDVQAMPSSYLIDRNGIIRHVHLGFRDGEAKELRAFAELLLAEKSAEK